jgi:hypothetical protein
MGLVLRRSRVNIRFSYGGANVDAFSYVYAATTNLFYMSNVMYDVWYQYGFNEINGNFQENNYERGEQEIMSMLKLKMDRLLRAKVLIMLIFPVDGTRGRMQNVFLG